MLKPTRYWKIAVASAALGAAALSYFQPLSSPASRPAAPRSVASSVAGIVPRSALPQAASRPVHPMPAIGLTAAAIRARPDPVGPEALRQLLPDVKAPVKNWKEYAPEKITIAPYPDLPMEFERVSVHEEHGRTVWTGRNLLDGAFLVTAATENDWEATLVVPPAGAFEMHVAGDTVTMVERNREDERCGTQPAMARAAALEASPVAPASSSNATAAADVVNTSDVLFFYDADTLTRVQNNPANFETRVIAQIASSNLALENSGVTNFRWRYLASYQVPDYTQTNDMADDLNVISGRVNNRPVANPVSTFVSDKATLHGADQVVLYVAGTRNFAGIAWIPSGPTPASLPLALHSAVVAWNTSFMALAHELGHNFGCYHDRDTEKAPDGDGQYHYGHRFLDRAGRDTGTIMSYAFNGLPYYSNPAVTFDGYVLGVPEGQPRAANNSRVLRDNAQLMVDTRPAVDPPAITAQPQAVTIAAGQSFTLSVTATGSNLSYQWKLDGAIVSGATGSSYSKNAATTADAGSYTVTIANAAGQVTSNPASLTVTGAPSSGGGAVTPQTTPVTTPPATTGGGGGGGGSVDGWFAAWCGVLILLRCAKKK